MVCPWLSVFRGTHRNSGENRRSRRALQLGDGHSHRRHFGFGVGTGFCARRKFGVEFGVALNAALFGAVGRGDGAFMAVLLPRASGRACQHRGAARQAVAPANDCAGRALSQRTLDAQYLGWSCPRRHRNVFSDHSL